MRRIITERDDKTVPVVAVIVTTDNGEVESFDAFMDDTQGNMDAETKFIEKMKVYGWKNSDDDKPLEECLEDGYAEFNVELGNFTVCITHS